MFYLNDSASTIGVDAQKVIQDGKIYQLLSHLVRTDVGLPDWQELYKKFVHPAGFHLGAEIVIQEPAGNTTISGVTAPLFDLSPTILFTVLKYLDLILCLFPFSFRRLIKGSMVNRIPVEGEIAS